MITNHSAAKYICKMRLTFSGLIFMAILNTVSAQVVNTAHRGASHYAPENTLAAVVRALQIGVDRVEVDVATTKDGVVVCLHDKTIDRTCQAKGDVRDLTYSELSKIKANRDFEESHPEELVPSLRAVMGAINRTCQLVIEIKSGDEYYPGIEKKVAELIKEFNAYDWALVHSFNDKVLERFPIIDPKVRLQKLFVFRLTWPSLMQDLELHFSSLEDYPNVEAFGVNRRFVNKGLVDEVHALGKKIHVWTVNEEDEMKELISMGVDGIITNKPDILNSLIKKEK